MLFQYVERYDQYLTTFLKIPIDVSLFYFSSKNNINNMKTTSITLSLIGLLSIIAGALAFKAQHRFSGTLACYTSRHIKLTPIIYTTNGTINSSPNLWCTIPGPRRYENQRVTLNL